MYNATLNFRDEASIRVHIDSYSSTCSRSPRSYRGGLHSLPEERFSIEGTGIFKDSLPMDLYTKFDLETVTIIMDGGNDEYYISNTLIHIVSSTVFKFSSVGRVVTQRKKVFKRKFHV